MYVPAAEDEELGELPSMPANSRSLLRKPSDLGRGSIRARDGAKELGRKLSRLNSGLQVRPRVRACTPREQGRSWVDDQKPWVLLHTFMLSLGPQGDNPHMPGPTR